MEKTSAPYFPVIIVGGGQAGLSVSYYLKQRGIEHLIFEEKIAFYAWREKRWDSFCLVTPNWQCRLPGFPYQGDDPEGFMKRDQIVAYLKGFLEALEPPILEGVKVRQLKRNSDGEFELSTTRGDYRAGQVVIASGNYQIAKIPRMAEKLPGSITQMHTSEYRNPDQLREGAVLVVGTGQSGCQIAEDLHLSGRQVHLCVGGAPRVARRYRGRDVVAWLEEMGHYSLPVTEHPLQEGVRAKANHYVTGRDGGRDIDLRVFAKAGMQLHGRLLDIAGSELKLGDDLQKNLDGADTTRENINRAIDKYIAERGLEAPPEAPYQAPWQPGEPLSALDFQQAGITTIIWSMGYNASYDWVELPAFDGKGLPIHHRGASPVEGLYFMGLPWLHTWGSGRFSGVSRDAQYVVDHMLANSVADSEAKIAV